MSSPLLRGALAGLSLLPPALALAQSAAPIAELPSVQVTSGDRADTFNPVMPPQVGKSSAPLSETPQSVTVVPRAVLDSQQAQTLADALHNVPGVVSNQFGRRGWDDLIIRGQVASDSLYLDGLRTAASNRVAEQLYGLEQVEVLKGPASMLYGLVLPGGLVNMVSKRPQAEAFANADVTVGSHSLYQGTVDMGTPLSDNGRAAFRLNALTMNSHDATDYVWFKNRWIAPSLSLDLGSRTDFTILTSYQERRYMRQQGLPLAGSVLSNPLGEISRRRYTGEPGQDPYRAFQTRVGYALTHRFDNGWTVNQNLRWQEFSMTGQFVPNGVLAADNRTLRRSAQDQDWSGDTFTVDTNAQRRFDTAFGQHTITVGTDYLRTRENALQYNCTLASLDMYEPVYGSAIRCPATPRTNSATTVRSVGVYLRDEMRLGQRWRVVAGLRRDDAATYSNNRLNGSRGDSPSQATTGSAAVMYELLPGVRPYVSYASSFYPNSGTDAGGNVFDPEKGSQWEAGVKIDLGDGSTSLTVAAFDLRRRNVLQSDPFNDGFSIAVGEQRTRGGEIGIVTDLGDGLSLMGGYAYTAAIITDDGGQAVSTEGDWLNNVPRHSFNLTARFRPRGEALGWEFTGGMRGESTRHAYGYQIPGYTVFDAGVAYNAAHWRAALTVRNLFDKDYFSGGLAQAVALGDGRTAMMTLGYRY